MKKFIFILLITISTSIHSQIIDVVTGFPAPGYMIAKDNFLFVTQNDTGNIYKIDITDPNPTVQFVISTGDLFPINPVIFENRLFYATSNTEEIYEIDLSDSQPTPQLFLSGALSVRGLFLDGTTLYISSGNSNSKIFKTNITTTNPILENVVDVNAPGQIWLENDELFMSAEDGEEILKININDSNPIPQLVAQTNANIQDLLIYNDELWFSYPALDKIVKLDSNNIIQMVGGIDYPWGLMTIDNFLYFTFDQKISKVDIGNLPLILETEDLKKENSIIIYPNPSKNFIYVKSATAILQLKIFDQLGNLVASEFSQNRIDISALSEGLYFMQIIDDDGGKILKKIIRE